MEQYYYSSATGQTYSAYQMQALFGIDVETEDITVINYQSFYPVQPTEPDFDTELYNASSTWVIVPITPSGEGAQLDFTPVAKPLPEAKENANIEEKKQTNQATINFYINLGYSPEVLVGPASQAPGSRPPRYQSILDIIAEYADTLNTKLDIIDAATTVDEINNVVNPPTGAINLYRTGTTLEAATFSTFESVSLTESGTELYVPGTATTIAWSGTDFPQTAGAFTLGDYVIQLRQVANGLVIAEFDVTEIDTAYTF